MSRIHGRSAVLEDGSVVEADAVVCNADLPYARERLEKGRLAKWRNSCSALVLYLDYDGKIPDLLHHNVFFSGDFRGNLEDIFVRRWLPSDPSFYACVSARTDPAKAAKGHENLMLLIPCPNLERPWDSSDLEVLRTRVYERLSAEVGFDASRVRCEAAMTPLDWRDQLNLHQGATFGLSHHFLQSAWFRPRNYSREHPGLYYVGASTIPGNGLPMVTISAELVVERMQRDGVI